MTGFVLPTYMGVEFTCPHCGNLASQEWNRLVRLAPRVTDKWPLIDGLGATVVGSMVTHCVACNRPAFWYKERLVYPVPQPAPRPAGDMPDEIAQVYDEASGVLHLSPRASAALLRLAIQKLMRHLGQPGDNLNSDIGALVEDGLPQHVQQALDVVRVIGNNAVHPGEIDLRDDHKTALALFRLVNLIIEEMITRPREVQALYDQLPAGARQAIERRDSNSGRTP